MPNVVELFCGCGGFALGARAAGLSPRIAFDVDPLLTYSHERNFPDTKLVLNDVSKIEGADIERELGGPVEGVFGGPPCQAFSEMGRRRRDDPRRSLVSEFFRLVAELQPAFFVMENVRGLLYPSSRPVLDHGLDLVARDYAILGPVMLDAADYGAATRRPRLFVIGIDPDRCDPLLMGDLDGAKTKATTVAAAISDLSSAVLVGDSDGFDLWKIRRLGRPSGYASLLRSADGTFTGHSRTAHTREVAERFASLLPGEMDAVGRHPRLFWGGQCPTLRAGTGNDRGSYQSVRPVHPDEPRVITVREAARLQGFPDVFRFHPTIWHSFRMIGNSVSPFVAASLFSLIAERTDLSPRLKSAAE